ncbi:MAG: flagellar biosynthesis anti-sigma factor FlgM [Desulfovibrionaceae bacterium]|nr:flagellar biosynthesis anti-sigma factor FlgM [Desulfovibrionaceae bacterium]
MEIKNTVNKLDQYAARLDMDPAGSRPASQAAERSAPVGDTVDIKSAGLKAAALETALAAPDFRADKVEAVKAALENGTYRINSQDIAAQMLQAGREIF